MDRSRASKLVAATLIQVYCHRKPPLFPRHRWTGSDQAMDWIAGLESCHGLFRPVFARFAVLCGQGGEASNAVHANVVRQASTVIRAGEDQAEEGAVTDSGVGLARPDSADRDLNSATELAAKIAQDRKLALDWLESKPHAALLILRTSMQPLIDLMSSQLHVASADFEIQQQSKLCGGGGLGSSCSQRGRDFRLTLAAHQQLEATLFTRVRQLFFVPSVWRSLPESALLTSTRCTIMRMLSRMGCIVHELIRHPHSLFPWCMFQLVQDSSQAARLRGAPDCVKDPWTLHMQEKHPDWTSNEFKHILLLHCALGTTDISHIEARHASLRRQLVAKSTQVKRMRFESVGAEWVCQQVRRWKLDAGVAQKRVKVRVSMAEQDLTYLPPPPS